MLNSVEKFLNDDHHDHDQSNNKDQSSGAAAAAVMVEGTLASGVEIWLRDVGNAKAKSGGLVLERWWVDHRLRTVVMSGGGGGGDQEHARKGSGKGKAKKGGSAVFSEEDREFFYIFGLVLFY